MCVDMIYRKPQDYGYGVLAKTKILLEKWNLRSENNANNMDVLMYDIMKYH